MRELFEWFAAVVLSLFGIFVLGYYGLSLNQFLI